MTFEQKCAATLPLDGASSGCCGLAVHDCWCVFPSRAEACWHGIAHMGHALRIVSGSAWSTNNAGPVHDAWACCDCSAAIVTNFFVLVNP